MDYRREGAEAEAYRRAALKARDDRLAAERKAREAKGGGGGGSVARVVISRSCMEHIYLRVCLPSIRTHCSSGAPH